MKSCKLPKVRSPILLLPLPKGVDDVLLDSNGSVAGPDSIQVNLIGVVDLSQSRKKLSHLFPVFRSAWVIGGGRALVHAAKHIVLRSC